MFQHHPHICSSHCHPSTSQAAASVCSQIAQGMALNVLKPPQTGYNRAHSRMCTIIAIGPSYSPAAHAPQPAQQPTPACSQNVRRCYLNPLRLLCLGSGYESSVTSFPLLHGHFLFYLCIVLPGNHTLFFAPGNFVLNIFLFAGRMPHLFLNPSASSEFMRGCRSGCSIWICIYARCAPLLCVALMLISQCVHTFMTDQPTCPHNAYMDIRVRAQLES